MFASVSTTSSSLTVEVSTSSPPQWRTAAPQQYHTGSIELDNETSILPFCAPYDTDPTHRERGYSSGLTDWS